MSQYDMQQQLQFWRVVYYKIVKMILTIAGKLSGYNFNNLGASVPDVLATQVVWSTSYACFCFCFNFIHLHLSIFLFLFFTATPFDSYTGIAFTRPLMIGKTIVIFVRPSFFSFF